MSTRELSIETLRLLRTAAERLGLEIESRKAAAAPVVLRDVTDLLNRLRAVAVRLSRATVALETGEKAPLADETVVAAREIGRRVDQIVRDARDERLSPTSDLLAGAHLFLRNLPGEATSVARLIEEELEPAPYEQDVAEEAEGLPGNPTTPYDEDGDGR